MKKKNLIKLLFIIVLVILVLYFVPKGRLYRYLEELRDFTVFNADAKPILSVSADGQRINQKDSEYYLNDEEALSKLITLANLIMRSNDLYHIVYSS